MNYGYIRVSSDKQTVENQRFEINNFCEREHLSIDGWIEETISGTKSYSKRELGTLLRRVRKDDLIICAELSRLGRNLFMIMEILNICMTKECKVWTSRTTIGWVRIFRARCWRSLSGCRRRSNATLSARERRRRWHGRGPRVWCLAGLKDGRRRWRNVNCTVRGP